MHSPQIAGKQMKRLAGAVMDVVHSNSSVVKRHRCFHKVAIGHYRAAHPDDLPTSA